MVGSKSPAVAHAVVRAVVKTMARKKTKARKKPKAREKAIVGNMEQDRVVCIERVFRKNYSSKCFL